MKILSKIAQILLGLIFLIFGLNGFFQFIPAPPPSGLVGDFITVMAKSHYFFFVSGVQVLAGVLLLINQFVPLALTLLGPMLANILVFHITMNPEGIGPGVLALILWAIVTWHLRSHFAPLLARQAAPTA